MFEEAASNLGRVTDGTMLLVTVVVSSLLLIITFLMVYFTVRYRRGRNPASSYIEGSQPLEWGWTAGGIALVLLLFYWGLSGYRERTEPPGDAFEVNVMAQMWAWSFEYQGGRTSGELVLPLGRPVKLVLNSRDVLHSFSVPSFRVKEDVVPGMSKSIWFTPERTGEFDIFCTEYCGTGHSMMLSKVRVLPEDEFAGWAGVSAGDKAPPGAELVKTRGCTACHSLDGSILVGPSFKGLYGKRERVVTAGQKREVVVGEEYIMRSMLEPASDVVEGFLPVMPSQKGILTGEEMDAIVEFIKTLQ